MLLPRCSANLPVMYRGIRQAAGESALTVTVACWPSPVAARARAATRPPLAIVSATIIRAPMRAAPLSIRDIVPRLLAGSIELAKATNGRPGELRFEEYGGP